MLYALQRRILFPAPPPRPLPAHAQTTLEGRSPRGRRVVALWSPHPRSDANTWTAVYFHGNGMQLADCAELAPVLHTEGFDFYAVEYPGYGPLAGDTPGEEAILDTASAAMDMLRQRLHVPPSRTLLLGQSLGTGVAVWLAARGAGARAVLLSPYRSIPAMAEERFPWLPARLLVRDRFDNEALAPSVTIPVRVVHGTDDEVVPFAHGVVLARRFPHGVLFQVEGARHNDLWSDHRRAVVRALRE